MLLVFLLFSSIINFYASVLKSSIGCIFPVSFQFLLCFPWFLKLNLMFLFYFLYQLQVLLDSCDLVSRSKLKLNSDG